MALEFTDGFVRVLGHRLYYKSIGEPKKGAVLCLHGGPGGTHWTVINMADIAPFGYKVVWYDQLGCGKSERLASYSGYTIERAADEADEVRRRLGLGRCHLWGYSYGGALALQTIIRHPREFCSLIVSSGYASSEELYDEIMRLVARLPARIRRAITDYEARGKMDDPEYQRAAEWFLRRHFSDLRIPPYGLSITRASMNRDIAVAMNGDSEAITLPATGTLAGWDVRGELRGIHVPALVTVGARDHVTPGCARTIHEGIADSKLVVFRKSGHDAIFKERDLYMKAIIDFLDSVPPATALLKTEKS